MSGVLDDKCRHRCLFYILHALSTTQANRKSGFIVLTPLVKTTRKSTLEKSYNARAMKLVQDEVFPISYVKSHLVILSTRSVFMAFTTLYLQLALRLGVSNSQITIHNYAQSPSAADDALWDLQNHGFAVESIPAVPFGGMFTIGCFREWLADRQRLENLLHDPAVNDGVASSTVSETAELHDTETRKRRADASYCRKKRFRKKIEIEVMQEEVERLRQQNGRLKEEKAKLEQWLLRAQSAMDAQRQNPSRVPTSLPLHGDHDRVAIQGIMRALAAPCGVSSAGQVETPRVPFSDPRPVGRIAPSWGLDDRLSSLGPATLPNPLLGAPLPAQLLSPVRPSLSVSPSRYNIEQALLGTLVGRTTNAADPLLSVASQTLPRQPLSTTHLDRSRFHVFHERTDPYDLQQLWVHRLLYEAFPPRHRGRDA